MRVSSVDSHSDCRRSQCYPTANEGIAKWKICGEAQNGQEAIAKATDLEPDLIILDLAMPIMNGLKAAREISKAMPAVPILMYTIHNSRELELEAKTAGVRRCYGAAE